MLGICVIGILSTKSIFNAKLIGFTDDFCLYLF